MRRTQSSKGHLILTLAMLSLASSVHAEEFVQRNGSATLELRTPDQSRRLALADVLSVTLTIEGETPIAVDAPLEMPAGSPWHLVKRTRPTRETIDVKHERWRITYAFAPREPGKWAFAFPDVRIGPDTVQAWKAETFDVTTSVADIERAKVQDITGVEELPAVIEAKANTIGWLAAGATMLVLLAGLIFVWQRSRSTRRSPAEIALYELSRLEAMTSSADGSESSRLVLLTTIVRRYLELAFALPARRRTTPEFLGLMQQTPQLRDEEKRFLSGFFLAMDAIRYAGVAGSANQFTAWAAGVRSLLQARLQTMSEPRTK